MRMKAVILSILLLSVACGGSNAEIRDGYTKVSDNLTLHYKTAGEGALTVVFIPGWTMTTDVYEHQLGHFDGSTKVTAVQL